MKIKRYLSLIRTAFVCFFLAYTWTSFSSQSKAIPCKNMISDLTELAKAVTEQAEFSNSKKHDNLFQFYRTQFLGDKDTDRTLKDVMDILEEHPELSTSKPNLREQILTFLSTSRIVMTSKPNLREQILTLEQRDYEPPQSLRDIIQRLKNSANQFQAQLFQPEANLGFWQRLLLPLKKEDLSGLSRKDKKAKQQEHKAQFREYFDQVLTPKDREVLKDDSINHKEKTIAVYRILERIRTQMIEEGKDVQAISQAMVDLVHTSGFRNPYYISMLKSQNALDQIKGLDQILNERDAIAMRLNFEDHFSELIRFLNVDHPTGSTKNENLSQILSDIQKEIQNSPYTVAGQQVLRVRALSLQESPFRGCLGGGSDCSTNNYFDLALDPNFIYFTLTDTEFKSSGQITVVLGTARSGKKIKRIKIAFVDKIQNVQQVMILPMLEAVRLSLKELGYRLGLPVDVGNYHELSSMETISAYIDSEVNPLFTHQLKDFKPHKSPYDFDQRGLSRVYSRAYSKPNLLEFERQEGDFKIEAGEINERSKIPEDLKAEDLFKEILSWKDSKKEEDQIKFISHLKSLTKIEESGLSEDFAKDYLKSKIEDRQMSFKVRKIALYTLLELWAEKNHSMINRDEVLNILKNFSQEEQTEILGEMSNWKNSNNHHRKMFIDVFSISVIEDSHVKDIVNPPLQRIIDIHSRSHWNGKTILFTAVRRGDQAMVQFFLDKGADINVKSHNRETILFTAVRRGDQDMVEFLLDHGIDINARDGRGGTALSLAEEYGNENIVRLLREKEDFAKDYLKSKIEDRQMSFKVRKIALYTLLELWAEKNDIMINRDEVLNILENFSQEEQTEILGEMSNWKNSNNHHRKKFIDVFSIRVIVDSHFKDFVNPPLHRIIDIHSRDGFYGETILFPAVRRGDQAMVQFFLDKGADINVRNNDGKTALSLAEEYGNENIVRLLREADIQAQNNSG